MNNARVLIADDEVGAAEMLAMFLRLGGHDARTARDGTEAVRRAEELRPDVIFMDLTMPGMDGLDAALEIRAQPWARDVVIAALTAWGDDSDKRLSREAGCVQHFVKPVDPKLIEDFLATLPDRGV